MRKGFRMAFWVSWFVAAGALPAYANNPPAIDGMFGIIMIFPVAILAFRFAGAKLTEKQKKWRILKGLLLTLTTVMAIGGGEPGFLAMLILLFYGLARGARAIQQGQGAKRFALGTAVILFAFFAAGNYFASLSNRPSSSYWTVAFGVREIISAEKRFQSTARRDVNKNGVGEYGSLEDLARAYFIGYGGSPPAPHNYRYVVVLSGDPARDEREFFVYATPTDYRPAKPNPWGWLPGASLRTSTRSPRYIDRFSFASDETGVLRRADLGGSRAVTREETRTWTALAP